MNPPGATEPPPNTGPQPWHCLRVQPKHEHIAAIHLRKQSGVETFAPRIRFQRSRSTGKTWVTEALFPSYIFARFDLESRWREVQHAHAVRGIVRFGDKYPLTPAAVIERLREYVGPEEMVVVDQSTQPGQEVVVTDGAFVGLHTVVTSYLPAKDRVKVLLNFLGREMEVDLSTASVLPAARKHPLALPQ